MFFSKKDKERLEKVEKFMESLEIRINEDLIPTLCLLNEELDEDELNTRGKLMSIERDLNKLQKTIDSTPDLQLLVFKFRELIEKTEDNMKRLNLMILEFKGWVSMSRAVINKKEHV